MLNESRPTRLSCKAAAIQTLRAISGERMWAEAAPNARLKETKDCASKEKPRTKPSMPNDSALMPPPKWDGPIIRPPPSLPLTYYPEEQESHRKTKTALTTREEFLAIVSHDLRNPLNHISMAVQNLLESLR